MSHGETIEGQASLLIVLTLKLYEALLNAYSIGTLKVSDEKGNQFIWEQGL